MTNKGKVLSRHYSNEETHQGQWCLHVMVDYWWSLQRACVDECHCRRSRTRYIIRLTVYQDAGMCLLGGA